MMNGTQPPMPAGAQIPATQDQTAQNIIQPQQLEADDKKDAEANKKRIPQKLKDFIESKNIAEHLSDDELHRIGMIVCHNTLADDSSRADWNDKMEKALEVAKQIVKRKNTPWEKCANIQYPLILTACMQFNARSFPNIVQNNQAVYVKVSRPNPTADIEESAKRIGNHISYQLIGSNDNWLDDKDKLLMILPLTGIVFTKTYYNEIEKMPVVDLCLPQDIIISAYAKSLEKAPRITHALYFSNNDIVSRQRSGLFLDIPLEDLNQKAEEDNRDLQNTQNQNPDEDIEEFKKDDSQEHLIYEQHCYLDLDNDNYAEPYIVTVHTGSEKVLRIKANYNYSSFIYDDSEEKSKSKQFVKIEPDQYFTAYRLMHSPDGNFYGMGFGQILYPLNESVNTVINQLLDAGTLSNMQSGFIGKTLRIQKRNLKLKPGEWQLVDNATGGDISKSIIPIPTKEPSTVLFQLLGMLTEAAQGIANVSDVMQGQMPAPNTPATTVVSVIEQGTKVFSGILLRLDTALKSEYNKIYKLNRRYLTKETHYQSAIASGFITPEDYQQNDFGIFPVADPRDSIEAQSLARAQALMQLMGNPNVDQREILTRYLKALKIPDIEKILPPPNPNPQPSPDEEKTLSEMSYNQAKTAEIYAAIEERAIKLDLEEKQLMINAEGIASTAANQKVDSIAKVTALEQTASQQQIDQAEQLTQTLTPDMTNVIEDLQNRINQLEQQSGIGNQQNEQMPQEQSEGQEDQMPQGEGMPEGQPDLSGLESSLEDKMESVSPGASSALKTAE